jgi:surface polysaccharide O-acyltransferase-like enzyme
LNKQFGQVEEIEWWAANFWQGLSRFCVPIFFMISGVTVLGRELPIKEHFRKPFVRIIIPFLCWHTVYMIFNWIIRLRMKPMDFLEILQFIGRQFQNYSSYHFWYIYTLIGIYCILPIFNKWINKASKLEIEIFLLIWLLTFLINNEGLFGWKFRIELPYNSGYIGYMVLGFYLHRQVFDEKIIKKLSLFFFLVGVGLVLLPTYWISNSSGKLDLRFYSNFTPGVLFESVGLFLMAKYYQWNWSVGILNTIRDFVSKQSYGIYCVHLLGLFYLAKLGIHFHVMQPFLGIPLTGIICLISCGTLIYLLKKLPFGKYFAG